MLILDYNKDFLSNQGVFSAGWDWEITTFIFIEHKHAVYPIIYAEKRGVKRGRGDTFSKGAAHLIYYTDLKWGNNFSINCILINSDFEKHVHVKSKENNVPTFRRHHDAFLFFYSFIMMPRCRRNVGTLPCYFLHFYLLHCYFLQYICTYFVLNPG